MGRDTLTPEALPYHVVSGNFLGSLNTPLLGIGSSQNILNFVVPIDHQLKILFIEGWTSDANGLHVEIKQTNPSASGQVGAIEAYPVVGAVPPYYPGLSQIRTVFNTQTTIPRAQFGSLVQPLHVLEGSVDFILVGVSAVPPTGVYSFSWWGVIKNPDEPPV